MARRVEPVPEPSSSEYHEPYARLSSTLRSWIVGYGIGAPVLFLSQERLALALLASPRLAYIVGLFIAGVVLQVFAALIYKAAMWYLYYGEEHEEFRSTRRHRISDWVSEAFWLELLLDALPLAFFVFATGLSFQALGVRLPPPP